MGLEEAGAGGKGAAKSLYLASKVMDNRGCRYDFDGGGLLDFCNSLVNLSITGNGKIVSLY